ncbi:hypothetical protein V2G26_015994 [Clonostachys chloroleuca]
MMFAVHEALMMGHRLIGWASRGEQKIPCPPPLLQERRIREQSSAWLPVCHRRELARESVPSSSSITRQSTEFLWLNRGQEQFTAWGPCQDPSAIHPLGKWPLSVFPAAVCAPGVCTNTLVGVDERRYEPFCSPGIEKLLSRPSSDNGLHNVVGISTFPAGVLAPNVDRIVVVFSHIIILLFVSYYMLHRRLYWKVGRRHVCSPCYSDAQLPPLQR